jgi:hypothetical protein
VCLLRGTDWVFIYNSTFCPHSVFMCFVWIWGQTAIISLYSINWLACITETECVYCAVRTGSLYIILRFAHTVYLCVLCGSGTGYKKHTLNNAKWWAMSQTASCWPLSTQTLVRSQASICMCCGGQSHTPTGFPSSTWFFPVTIILPMLHIHFQVMFLLPEWQTGEAWEPSKK